MTNSTAYKLDDLINLSQAAELLSVSYPTVFALMDRGELEPVRIATRRYLVRAEVEELRRRRSGDSK